MQIKQMAEQREDHLDDLLIEARAAKAKAATGIAAAGWAFKGLLLHTFHASGL